MQPLVQQLHGLSFEAVIQEIHQNGLASTCSFVTSATSCVETAISECGSELPLEIRQIAQFLISAVNFECVEEFELFNANRQCLYDVQLLRSILMSCQPSQPATDICSVIGQMDCGINIVTQRCGQQVGAALNRFQSQQQAQFGCNLEYHWEQFAAMLR